MSFQSLKDDVIVNSTKNKLDDHEEDSNKRPPFNEVGEISTIQMQLQGVPG